MYVDIHNHILFGLDDGPRTIEETIKMIRIAQKNKFGHIIATPHHNNYHRPEKREILTTLEQVNQVILKEGYNILLYPGNEFRISIDLPDKLKQKEVLPLANSNYILLEFPFEGIPIFAKSVVGELTSDGWQPILAHCERIYDIQQDIDKLKPYINMGCLIQANANSITRELGIESYNSVIKLLKLGYVDIIASDAHNPTNRVPSFDEALKITSKIVGLEKAMKMVTATPMKILEASLKSNE